MINYIHFLKIKLLGPESQHNIEKLSLQLQLQVFWDISLLGL